MHIYIYKEGPGDLSVKLFKLTVFYTEEAQKPAANEDLVSEFSCKLCNRSVQFFEFSFYF